MSPPNTPCSLQGSLYTLPWAKNQAVQVQAARQISWLPDAILLHCRKIGDRGP